MNRGHQQKKSLNCGKPKSNKNQQKYSDAAAKTPPRVVTTPLSRRTNVHLKSKSYRNTACSSKKYEPPHRRNMNGVDGPIDKSSTPNPKSCVPRENPGKSKNCVPSQLNFETCFTDLATMDCTSTRALKYLYFDCDNVNKSGESLCNTNSNDGELSKQRQTIKETLLQIILPLIINSAMASPLSIIPSRVDVTHRLRVFCQMCGINFNISTHPKCVLEACGMDILPSLCSWEMADMNHTITLCQQIHVILLTHQSTIDHLLLPYNAWLVPIQSSSITINGSLQLAFNPSSSIFQNTFYNPLGDVTCDEDDLSCHLQRGSHVLNGTVLSDVDKNELLRFKSKSFNSCIVGTPPSCVR